MRSCGQDLPPLQTAPELQVKLVFVPALRVSSRNAGKAWYLSLQPCLSWGSGHIGCTLHFWTLSGLSLPLKGAAHAGNQNCRSSNQTTVAFLRTGESPALSSMNNTRHPALQEACGALFSQGFVCDVCTQIPGSGNDWMRKETSGTSLGFRSSSNFVTGSALNSHLPAHGFFWTTCQTPLLWIWDPPCNTSTQKTFQLFGAIWPDPGALQSLTLWQVVTLGLVSGGKWDSGGTVGVNWQCSGELAGLKGGHSVAAQGKNQRWMDGGTVRNWDLRLYSPFWTCIWIREHFSFAQDWRSGCWDE